jgi:hypothetical protein
MAGSVLVDAGFPIALLSHRDRHHRWSLADACLVRMSETFGDPILLTTDADFGIYRHHSRQVVPCPTPF